MTETPVIENTVLLILPFSAYLPADKFGASGVLAVVAAGLTFGHRGARSLSAAARNLFSADQGVPATRQDATVMGWAGRRGAVSTAAALALPQAFPGRDLVAFLTLAVIVATLVGQGLTLPPLIRRLGLVTRDQQDPVLLVETRRRLTVVALERIDDLAGHHDVPGDVLERVRRGYEAQLDRLVARRRVSRRVAEAARAALDVDETTVRP